MLRGLLLDGTRRTGDRFPHLAVLAVGASLLAGCGSSGNPAVVQVSRAGGSCPGGAVTSLGARRLAGTLAGRAARCPYDVAAGIGKPGEGLFRQPGAIAVGPAGRVYVADQFSHLVQVFSSAGAFEGQWGSGGAGPGQFGGVGGLAVDHHGNVYVVDAGHDRVEKFTASGRLITSWGSPGTGVGQFNFGGGGGSYQPPGGGIAVGNSYVYVSDTANNRIVRFSLNGSGARVVVGAGSGRSQVLRPKGLALAPAQASGSGRQEAGVAGEPARAPEALYVADDGNDRVQELDAQGHFIAEAGFFPVGRGFENPPASAPGGFVYNSATQHFVRRSVPFDVAVHGGLVYVADDNYGAIVKLTRDLRFVGSFSGSGGEHLSHFVRAVAADAAGRVYVTDASANHVVVFDSSGTPLRSWGASGTAPGQFLAPVDVAAGPRGELLVAEPLRGTGEIVPLYSTGTPLSYNAHIAYESLWSSGGGVRLGNRLFSPNAVAFAPDGSVWVSDRNNKVLRHLSADGHFLGAVGAPAGAGPASFTEPHGLAVDSGGHVIVADTGADRVSKLAADGRTLGVWSAPGALSSSSAARAALAAHGFRRPLAAAAGPKATIYVADTGNARVVQLDAAGRLIATWGGRGTAPGRFVAPTGIQVDSAGHVFVSDGVLDRIQEFTPAGKLLALWGAAGSRLGELSEPAGLTVDCHGDLLVADTGNNRVQVFTGVAAIAPCKT